jgi:PAS domain S-box-containing protein
VIVQHLSPDFKSLMKELLERRTDMPIHRVEDSMELRPDSIYLIPPKKTMKLEDRKLRLYEPESRAGQSVHLPIDHFFESVAREIGPRAVGVILSGTGSDGTKGVRAIHDSGGLVFIQEPETAQFDGMPRSAIQTEIADYILPIESIAQVIHRYAKQADEGAESLTPIGSPEESFLTQVNDLLRQGGGIDFSHYRSSTLLRRVDRRMSMLGVGEYESYLELLKDSRDERETLHEDLLISVTCFFRDPESWESLRQNVLSALVGRSEHGSTLRLWVTACATGEEAYSLAMLVLEEMESQGKRLDVKVFATDVDAQALERAAEGLYPDTIAGDVSEERLARFFKRRGSSYQVIRELREMLIFARHDLTRNAPFTKMDVVTCRNVLIYMQPALQQQVVSTLHFALNPHGAVLLGSAETLGEYEDEFKPIDRGNKLFEKKRHVLLPSSGRRQLSGMGKLTGGIGRSTVVTPPPPPRADAYFGAGLQQLFASENAVCLIADENACLMHTYGDAERFFKAPSGRMSTELHQLVRAELATPVRTSVHRARSKRTPVVFTGIRLAGSAEKDRVEEVELRTVYCEDTRSAPEFFVMELRSTERRRESGEDEVYDADASNDQRVEELEHELQHVRENLQATIEELETTNEEQQSTNEELLASNEELQSTNEELHSVNEELYTVNAEYQKKISELTEANNDIDNLLRSTDIGTVFLDPQLRIRKFTPSATAYFNLVEHDIGRPIAHLSHRIEFDNMLDDLSQVALSGGLIEREVRTRDGGDVLLRVTAYRTGQSEHRGVVLTLVDVSELTRVRKELERSEHRFRQMAETITSVFWISSADMRSVLYVSPAFESIWGRPCEDLYNDASIWHEAVHADDLDIARDASSRAERGEEFDVEYRITRADGEVLWLRNRGYPVFNAVGQVQRVVGVTEDVTPRVTAQGRQAELAQLVETSSDAIIGCDGEGSITTWNGAAEELFGVEAASACGRSLGEFQPAAGDFGSLVERLRSGEAVDSLESITDARTGQQRDVLMRTSQVRDRYGRFVGASTIVRDITDQRRLRDALREQTELVDAQSREMDYIYLSAPIPLGLLDDRLVCVRANDRLASLAGASAAECAGEPLSSLLPGLSPSLEPICRTVAETGEAVLQQQVTAPTRPGGCDGGGDDAEAAAEADWLVSVFPVSTTDSEGTAVGLVVQEITEIKRTQRALESANAELTDQHVQMEQFVYTVSHDLKSPLVTIDGMAALLERSLGDHASGNGAANGDGADLAEVAPAGVAGRHTGETPVELVDTLRSTTRRMRRTIDDLLRFSRIGRVKAEPEPLALVDLLEDVTADMSPELDGAGVTVTLCGPLPTVTADRGQLRHVFENLLTNVAQHAAGESGCAVSVSAEGGDDGGAVVTVRDDGPGIARDHHDRVFEPFERLDRAGGIGEGSGIGLAIVRRVLETLGGRAWVESESGAGAAFRLWFPAAVSTMGESADAARGEGEAR